MLRRIILLFFLFRIPFQKYEKRTWMASFEKYMLPPSIFPGPIAILAPFPPVFFPGLSTELSHYFMYLTKPRKPPMDETLRGLPKPAGRV